MKTYVELEEIGVVEKFVDVWGLHIICKDKSQWKYNYKEKRFE